MADSLRTAKVQADLCNLPNESNTVYLSLIIVFSIVYVCVALRIATKILTKRIRTNDYVLVVALLSTATYGCDYASMFTIAATSTRLKPFSNPKRLWNASMEP